MPCQLTSNLTVVRLIRRRGTHLHGLVLCEVLGVRLPRGLQPRHDAHVVRGRVQHTAHDSQRRHGGRMARLWARGSKTDMPHVTVTVLLRSCCGSRSTCQQDGRPPAATPYHGDDEREALDAGLGLAHGVEGELQVPHPQRPVRPGSVDAAPGEGHGYDSKTQSTMRRPASMTPQRLAGVAV